MSGEFSSPIDIGLSASPIGIDNEAMYEEFTRVYNAIRILQQKFGTYNGLEVLDPTKYINELAPAPQDSIQVQRLQPLLVKASVAITAGEFVNLFLSGGILQARKADAGAGIAYRAWGWAPNSIALNAVGIVYLQSGWNGGFAGMTIGATYYLHGITPGGINSAPPVVGGSLKQEVGIALTATDLYVRISTPIIN